MIPKLKDEKWLREQYVDKRRTLESIAQEIGCNKGTVGRALKVFEIGARKRTSKHPQLADYDWLYNAYIVEKRGMNSIAKEVGASVGVVGEHLRQKGIPTRSVREGMENAGLTSPIKRLGDKAKNWQGGRQTTTRGYIYIYKPDHPHTTVRGCVMEHRLVMEEKIGRYLEPGEVVHHIDGNKMNNDPSNLELKSNSQHISDHFQASHETAALRKRVAELEQQLDIRDEYIRSLEQELVELCE